MRALACARYLAIIVVAGLVASVAFVGSGCAPGGWKGLVKLGLVAPFSGYDQTSAYDVHHAVKMAVAEANARGGVGGYRVELVALDDGNDPRTARYQARELAVDGKVIGVVGHLSTTALLAGAPEYSKAGLAVLSPAMAPDDLVGAISLNAGQHELAAAIVEFAYGRVRATNLVVMYQEGADFQGVAEKVARKSEDRGRGVVLQALSRQDREFRGAVESLQGPGAVPLVIFVGDADQGAALAVKLRAETPGAGLLFAGDVDSGALGKFGGKAVEGAWYVTSGLDRETPAAKEFAERYHAAGQRELRPNVALAYDAANIILAAAARAGGGAATRMLVRENLANVWDYHGVTGSVSFGADGRRLNVYVDTLRLTEAGYPGRRDY